MKPGTLIRMSPALKAKLRENDSGEHADEFEYAIGVVEGLVDYNNNGEEWSASKIGPEYDVRWYYSGPRYGYAADELVMVGMVKFITIAIDGPAASGKGTLSQRIAAHYGLRHLDTGLSYRAVAKALLDAGQPLGDEALAVRAALALDLSKMKRDELAVHAIGEAASKIAVMSDVRKMLVDKQRAFAYRPEGAVLDGRDIGTVVCPDATVKLYVIASPEVRAKRRYHEILARGNEADEAQILADIKLRDERDMGRADSPLKPAEDAHLLDTSKMTIEAAFEAAKSIIDAAIAKD